MDDLIRGIFEELEFEYIENRLSEPDILFVIYYKNDDKKEYFVATFFNSLKNIDEVQKKIHAKLRKDWKELNLKSDWEKNTTMLIFYRTDLLPVEKSINSDILEIEENPYFFKKHVFAYTDHQVEQFNNNKKSLSNRDFLSEYINTVAKYEEFKKSSKDLSENLYALISRLHIKLPFLSLPVVPQEKYNVVADFKENLSEKEKSYYEFLIELDKLDADSYEKMEKLVWMDLN